MIESIVIAGYQKAFSKLFGNDLIETQIQVQKTKAEFEGDVTVVMFPHLKIAGVSPNELGEKIGDVLIQSEEFKAYNIVKGFLNLTISDNIWLKAFHEAIEVQDWWKLPSNGQKWMVEYSSPNTNKPLHLGHLRNNVIGYSVAELLKAGGYDVLKTQIINDRGIHICKSMLAWLKWGKGNTPEKVGMKGDHFVAKYYVMFENAYKSEMKDLMAAGKTKEEAMQQAPLFVEAQEMLRKWESDDQEVIDLWKRMNGWVYEGFDVSYKKIGVDFDVLYYESDTYKLGKEIVEEGLQKGVFYKREDGSVWCDLTEDGLDEKLVLRRDGTSVYITQDIGTAIQRYKEHQIDGMIYTVANEQDYHFKVLFLILKKLGYPFAKDLHHLSYGMVDLPSGKMKTREGNVVDSDELIDEMVATAGKANEEKGKLEGLTPEQIEDINYKVGMAALKYYLIKVDPKKGMVFNPEESIDFNGNTGPFVLFNYVRTRSILRKIEKFNPKQIPSRLLQEEKELIQKVLDYHRVIEAGVKQLNSSLVANYAYELAKMFSTYYANIQILKADDTTLVDFRVSLSRWVGDTIENAFAILGISMPQRM
jgi:arginyl-tRNA synthetase